jgi:diguanylate cyclase (GGDEF)-like protein
MRNILPWLLLLPASFILNGALCLAAVQGPLTSVQQIVAISNAEAANSVPVKLEATVTYVHASEHNLFVMEDGSGVYVRLNKDIGLLPGDRIAITGITAPSFRPILISQEIHVLSHGSLPIPKPATFQDLIKAKWDSQYVVITGHVLSAALDPAQASYSLRIQVKVPGGTVEGIIAVPGKLRSEELLDADVRLSGVAGGAYDSKMQLAGMWLDINSWKEVVILRRPVTDPWSLAPIPMDDVVSSFRYSNQSARVRIAGTLTYYEPGLLAVLEHQGRSMLIKTRSKLPLHTGMGVEATGFPAIVEENVLLQDAQLRPETQVAQLQPQPIDWENASAGKYAYNLVSMEGEVVGLVHDSRVDLFIIYAAGHLFSATLRQSSSDAAHAPSSPLTPSIGSRVRVTGVCFVEPGDHWHDRLWFDIRMRSLEDIAVLQQPTWWTVKRLAYLITLLSVVILVAVIWVGLLDRRLRKQTAILARQSQEDAIRERRLARQELQRSHILELISSSEPLPEVLREIQSMVSSRLYGAPCWFELNANSEEEIANPEHQADQATVFQDLFSPDGISLGRLLATPLLRTSAESEISSALTTGARLAELAIDTRRLYHDLRHRSEHDLLTDIPNRFSMERELDRLMNGATRDEPGDGSVFGLIYVDLDRFKQINDRYGHRTGDLYLQEVTLRMKLQLRSGDTLARIGGDEFIALTPILRSRADAEDIAMRLDRCFDEPFDLEGCRLQGSASVGLAVYPEDGATKEDLQRSADAAMYAHKQAKRHQVRPGEELQRVGSDDLLH